MIGVLARLRRRLRGAPSVREEMTSLPLRARYAAAGVDVGAYSYGCFDLARIPPGTTVGRYCSFARSAQVFLRNHGTGFLGTTAYFYNPDLGVVDRQMMPATTLTIADDVWVGHNAVLLPGVGTIGRGAVIAAGAVVTRAVPAYAIVAGNPARLVRMRFDDAVIARIEETRWWEREPDALRDLVRSDPDLVFDPVRRLREGANDPKQS